MCNVSMVDLYLTVFLSLFYFWDPEEAYASESGKFFLTSFLLILSGLFF